MNTNVSILDLYIPNVSISETEETIRSVFYEFNIGTISYIDFVAVKDKEQTDLVLYYSAFIKMTHWSSEKAVSDFRHNGKITINLSRNCFWTILPSKKIVPRTKVNIHQLAFHTEDLFERFAKMEKMMEQQQRIIEIQQQKLELNDDEIENQKRIIESMEKRISSLEKSEEKMVNDCVQEALTKFNAPQDAEEEENIDHLIATAEEDFNSVIRNAKLFRERQLKACEESQARA